MTDIVICGANGKMGRTIYSIISDRDDCRVVGGIDINTQAYADFPIVSSVSQLPKKPDAIIDYSHPSSLDGLLEYGLMTGTPVVLATTGYSEEQIEKIKKASEQFPVFFSWNMSLGINLLVELSKKAASVLGNQFDIEIIEKHHNQKIDAPSGTALMLANAINSVFDNSKQYIYDRHSQRKKREPKEIGIHAVRGGTIVGEHEVMFAGKDEVITLSHSAASKSVFAVGSINAAVFIKGKPAGLYDMSSMLKES
ncbi:MAG: 4-hydroxy-tetrahydrodipicolinate reductase [Oscillospiraceae bacterium]|nr:4-hydroxy-tetrahydrodipicolinate reductase [Oscillospiraceae bacterium]